MALVNINANFTLLLGVLDRIATALERLAGPDIPLAADIQKRGPEAIINYGNMDRAWAREHFQNLIHEQGLAPDQEQRRLDLVMKRYDYESQHGGEAPSDE